MGLITRFGKTKVMVIGGITKDGLSISEGYLCEICGWRFTELGGRYGECIHSRCK